MRQRRFLGRQWGPLATCILRRDLSHFSHQIIQRVFHPFGSGHWVSKISVGAISWNFFLATPCCIHVGSLFPDQESNPHAAAVEAQSLNHGTVREGPHLFSAGWGTLLKPQCAHIASLPVSPPLRKRPVSSDRTEVKIAA